jgi:hypothetical protein
MTWRAALALLAGCAAQPSAWCAASAGGFDITFPNEPTERLGHEGPFVQSHLMTASDGDGVYELALFSFARDLDGTEQGALLRKVERGLSSRSPKVQASATTLDGKPARALSMRLDGGRTGWWLIAYLDHRRMIQLSAVGGGTSRRDRFFRSFNASGNITRCAAP